MVIASNAPKKLLLVTAQGLFRAFPLWIVLEGSCIICGVGRIRSFSSEIGKRQSFLLNIPQPEHIMSEYRITADERPGHVGKSSDKEDSWLIPTAHVRPLMIQHHIQSELFSGIAPSP